MTAMTIRISRVRAWAVPVLLASHIFGCTTEIYAPAATNPPPTEPFKNFATFRLEPVEDDGTGTRLVWRVPVR